MIVQLCGGRLSSVLPQTCRKVSGGDSEEWRNISGITNHFGMHEDKPRSQSDGYVPATV